MKKYFILIVLLIFVLLTAVFYLLTLYYPLYSFTVLMTGNGLMAGLSAITFYMVRKQMSQRPEAFVRGVYGATFLKLLVCMSAILLYAFMNRDHLYKPGLFVLFGIYAVYTIAETVMLAKISKTEK